jgi:hypothetical protein
MPSRGMSIAMQIILEPVKAQIALKVAFDMVKGGHVSTLLRELDAELLNSPGGPFAMELVLSLT